MIEIEDKIISALTSQEACLIHFIDIRNLSLEQNRGLPNAVFWGVALPPSYVRRVMETTDYVQSLIARNKIEEDEYHLTEIKAGKLADCVADLLISEGYRAYSQSDGNLIETGAWDEKEAKSPLPHKTVAVLAGVGWIGKNNLLVTPEYGPALCIGTVLTNAPLHTTQPMITENRCGRCEKCVCVCQTDALSGNIWNRNLSREDIIDIRKCTTCLKCLVQCVYTQRYIKRQRYED